MGQQQQEINEIKNILSEESSAETVDEVSEATQLIEDNDDIGELDNIDDVIDTDDNSIVETVEEETVEDDEIVGDGTFPTDLLTLADAIDVDISDLYGVKIKLADGEEPKTISELKNSYQESARNEERLQKTITDQQAQIVDAQNQSGGAQQLNAAEMKLMSQQQALVAEYNQTDWGTLETQNPGEAALLRQKFQQAGEVIRQQGGQLNQQKQNQVKQNLTNAASKVMELIPTWSDTTVRQTQTKAIEQLLRGEGRTDRDIQQLSDPVSIKLLDELVTLRAKFAQAEDSVEKVRRVPKTIHGGARKKANPNKKTNALINKARNTTNHQGKRQAELAAVKHILGGG